MYWLCGLNKDNITTSRCQDKSLYLCRGKRTTRSVFSIMYAPLIYLNLPYSWIGHPIRAVKTSIYQRTRRATINPRPPMNTAWQGESRSSGYVFLWSFFDLLFFKTSQTMAQTKMHRKKIGFASSNTLVLRSQVLLRCLGLLPNWFFSLLRKSSKSACAW